MRRPARAVAAGAAGPVWLAEHTQAGRVLGHSDDLEALFAPDPWLLDFVRSGHVGWRPYAEAPTAQRRRL